MAVVTPEEQTIRDAYKRFYAQKYPGRAIPEADFHHFARGHKTTFFQKMLGLMFVPLSREVLLSREITDDTIKAVLRNGMASPDRDGWYVLVGHRVRMFIGRTHTECVALFSELAKQL